MDTFGGVQETGRQALAQAALSRATRQAESLSNGGVRDKKIAQTAQEFESVFLSQVIGQLFADIPPDPLFGGGHAEETFRTLLNDEYGKAISRAGGIGIAAHVQRELLQIQKGGSGL